MKIQVLLFRSQVLKTVTYVTFVFFPLCLEKQRHILIEYLSLMTDVCLTAREGHLRRPFSCGDPQEKLKTGCICR